MASCASCKKRTTSFCYVHKASCCDDCIPTSTNSIQSSNNHCLVNCVVGNYFDWLADPDYSWPTKCFTCNKAIGEDSSEVVRLVCKCLFHRQCLRDYVLSQSSSSVSSLKSLLTASATSPASTSPHGIKCPACVANGNANTPQAFIYDTTSHARSKLRENVRLFLVAVVNGETNVSANNNKASTTISNSNTTPSSSTSSSSSSSSSSYTSATVSSVLSSLTSSFPSVVSTSSSTSSLSSLPSSSPIASRGDSSSSSTSSSDEFVLVSNDSYSMPSSAAPSNRNSPAPGSLSLSLAIANTQLTSSASTHSILADTSRLPQSVQHLVQKAQQAKEREEKEKRQETGELTISFNSTSPRFASSSSSTSSSSTFPSSSSSSSFSSRDRSPDDHPHDGDVEDDEDHGHSHGHSHSHDVHDIETGHQEPEEGEDKTAKPSRWGWSREDKKSKDSHSGGATPQRKNDGAGRFAFAFRHRKGEKKGQLNLAMLFLCLLFIIFLFGSGLYFSYMKRMAGLTGDSTANGSSTTTVSMQTKAPPS